MFNIHRTSVITSYSIHYTKLYELADKALHMDFIHTSEGCPVYIEHTDNYEDLRQRFMKTVNQLRGVLGIEKKRTLTFTIDRGIYGYDFFEGIIPSEFYHVITWEKGFV